MSRNQQSDSVKILTRKELNQMSMEDVIEAYFALAEYVKELQSVHDSETDQIGHINERLAVLQASIDNLKERIRLLVSRKYGCKSESTRRFRSSDLPEDIDDDMRDLLIAVGLLKDENSSDKADVRGDSNGNGNTGSEKDDKATTGSDKEKNGEPNPGNKNPEGNGNSGSTGGTGAPKGKPKGNPHLKRTAGFKHGYLGDRPFVYMVDGSCYSEQEVIDHFGFTREDLAYLRNSAYVTTTVEVIPAQYFNVVHIQPCARHEDEAMYLAGSSSLLRNSILSPSLMAHLMGMHYELSLPWNRTEKYLSHDEVHFARSTMITWAEETTDKYLSPLNRRMRRLLLQRKVLQADETFITVVNDEREGSHNSYFWQFRTSENEKDKPTIICFVFDKTREERVAAEFLEDFEGHLMTDAYVCYKELGEDNPLIISCLCWQHMRRMFWDVLRAYPNFFQLSADDQNKVPAWQIIMLIRAIYKAEKEVKAEADPVKAQELRDTKVRKAVDACFEAIKTLKKDEKLCVKGGLLAKAVNYALNGEDRFRNFLTSVAVPMDNQASERSMIDISVLRNNIKLIDSLSGAEREAVGFTIYETAKAAGVNPELYFRYVYEMMPKIIADHELEIKDEKNDLVFLDCMMPWSEEYKAYAAQQSRVYESIFAEALTRYNLFDNCPIDSRYLVRIIENEKNHLHDALGKYTDELKKQPESLVYYQSRVKGMIIPEWSGPDYYLHAAKSVPQQAAMAESPGSPPVDPPVPARKQAMLEGTA